jgi:hypothetical protein
MVNVMFAGSSNLTNFFQTTNYNQMKTSNIIKIASGVVLAATAIASGVAYKKAADSNAKKEAERLAYENRPIIEAACIMNGFGEGNCKFTNTGKTAGPQCGYIEVRGPGVAKSEQFCSGLVQPYTTNKVEFSIPEVRELCSNGFEDWTKKCPFNFVFGGLGQGAV